MKKIESVIVERVIDIDTDLGYLGTFTNELADKVRDFAVVKHNGDNRSYPYFIANDVSNKKEALQNYKRIMKYENGQLCDHGVKATAKIYTGIDSKSWLINKVSSGGVWGLSSDSDNSEFDNEAENQLGELREVLLELGFSEQEISEAKVEYKNWY